MKIIIIIIITAGSSIMSYYTDLIGIEYTFGKTEGR